MRRRRGSYLQPIDDYQPIVAGNRLHQLQKCYTVEPTTHLRGDLTQLQRVAGLLIDAGMNIDLSNAAAGRQINEPALEIRLRQSIGLRLPKTGFRLYARQIR